MSERIVVIGAGPIGGIIGGRLARAGADITFVDVDNQHIRAIRENGLYVDVPDGAFNVQIEICAPPELRGTFDVGLIAVRSNYTPEALATVLPHLTGDGVLVSMQNGINPPLLEGRVGPERAIGMAIRMGSRRLAPGRLHTATRGHLYVGHLHGRMTPQLARIAKLFDAVIETEISDNILGVLWSKLTYTCLGYYGSLADSPLSTICAAPAERQNLANFFAEVVGIGSAAGVRWIPLAEYSPLDFHPAHAPADRLNALDRFAAAWKANDRKGPLRQIQQGLKTEVDFTLGYVVAQAREQSVPVPLCEKVLTMIHELESGRRKLSLDNYAELRF